MNSIGAYPDLAKRKILVTGASSGIGKACAEALLDGGASVAVHAHRNTAVVEAMAAAHPDSAHPLSADLSTESGCVSACAEAMEKMGGLDGLIHSAGIWTDGAIRNLDAQTLETMFRTNTFSSYYLARECARTMNTGTMVFIGSTAGQRGEPGHSHYAGSKGAVQSMVMSLAQELAPSIRVNIVSPGWVRTPMSEAALTEREEAITSLVPLKRVAEAEDVASGAIYLTADAGRHLTGVDLCCSGGALLPMPRG